MQTEANAISISDLIAEDDSTGDGFDRLTRLATAMFNTPVALVSLVEFDRDRQFFASEQGLAEPWASKRETPLSHSFCQHVKTTGAPLVVRDAREDSLVRDNLAIPDLGVIAYLGVPIYGTEEKPVGALCVIDGKPRDWSEDDVTRLADLAGAVTDQIKLQCAWATKGQADRRAARLGRIVQQAHHEIFAFDPETFNYIEVNAVARSNLGYSAEELQSMSPLDVKENFSAEELNKLVTQLKTQPENDIRFESMHRRKDGTTYTVSVRLELHEDDEGSMFVAFCEDVSERRALEKEFRLKSADFETLFMHSPDAIGICELDTTRTLVSPGLARISGKPAEELIGERFVDSMESKQSELVLSGIASRTPQHPHFSYLHQQEVDGTSRSLLWTNIVLFDEDKPERIFSVGRDVTDLQNARMLAETKAREAETANRAKRSVRRRCRMTRTKCSMLFHPQARICWIC